MGAVDLITGVVTTGVGATVVLTTGCGGLVVRFTGAVIEPVEPATGTDGFVTGVVTTGCGGLVVRFTGAVIEPVEPATGTVEVADASAREVAGNIIN
ncbi:MAG: hypothetical protein NVS1B7_6050 [Candidatus Saccharimonadales bacterium]